MLSPSPFCMEREPAHLQDDQLVVTAACQADCLLVVYEAVYPYSIQVRRLPLRCRPPSRSNVCIDNFILNKPGGGQY